MGLFGKIRDALKKTKDSVSLKLRQLFLKDKIGEAFYDELEEIAAVRPDGSKTVILRDGRFVLPGTETLNEPLEIPY